MFRKRQPPAPTPPQQGYWAVQSGYQGVSHSTPSTTAIAREPQRALVRVITLLFLSNDHRCAQELLQALEGHAGPGRYNAAWVASIEHMLKTMADYRYDLCLLDLGCAEIGRLEASGYQQFGEMPYVAVLNAPSLNAQMRQELEARGYYGYIGYPFDGQAADGVLRALVQTAPDRYQAPPPVQRGGGQMGAATGSGPAGPAHQGAYQAPPRAAHPGPDLPMSGTAGAIPGSPLGPGIAAAHAPPAPAFTTPLAPSPTQALQPSTPPMTRDFPATAGEARATALAVPLPTDRETPPVPHTTATAVPRPPDTPLSANADPFIIQPQLVRQRGLFVCWSPFDGAQRTSAALNLATALAFEGFRTLVGELRRPAGPLASYLRLTKEETSRSLLAAACASERLIAQKGYVMDQELLEDHLLNAIPLDPHDEESPEVHFFLSGPPQSPQLLFSTPALDPNQSPFVPELLQTVRHYWDFAFIVVGSSPVDKLHWQAFRACDRLLVFLPPDEAYLTQTGHLLPAILRASSISPSNVDVILTQIDRGLLAEHLDPSMRFLAKTATVDDRQTGSPRGKLPRNQPQLEEKQLRVLERQLQKLAVDDALRGKLEGDVKSILKAGGLEDKLAGALPDVLPLMQSLRRKNRPLLPLVMQRDFVTTPYVSAIRDLLEAWIKMTSRPPGLSKRPEVVKESS